MPPSPDFEIGAAPIDRLRGTDDENRGRIMLVGGERFVVDSFDKFIDKYLTDNNSVC